MSPRERKDRLTLKRTDLLIQFYTACSLLELQKTLGSKSSYRFLFSSTQFKRCFGLHLEKADSYKDIKSMGLNNEEESSKRTSINVSQNTRCQEQSWARHIQTYLNMTQSALISSEIPINGILIYFPYKTPLKAAIFQ